MKKLLLVFIFSILITSLVTAKNPQQTAAGQSSGFVILFPDIDSLPQNVPYDFHFHVFNLTDGTPVFTGVSLVFHLYSADGTQVYSTNLTSDGVEWSVIVAGSNFSKLGSYSYLVYANSTGRGGGYDKVFFTVSPLGEEVSSGKGISYSILLVIACIFFFIMLYGAISIPWENPRNDEDEVVGINYKKYAKIILIVFSYISLLFIFGLLRGVSYNFTPEVGVYRFFEWGYWILLSCLYPGIVLAFILGFIRFIYDKKIQKSINSDLPW